jgi:general secretion pathway protein B
MSYILDALRKAEAERRMGSTPDTPAAPLFHDAQAGRGSGWRGNRWLWVLLAGAGGALAAAAWLQWESWTPTNTPTSMPAPSATAVASAPRADPPAAPAPVAVPEPASEPASAPAATVTMHEPPPPVAEAARPAAPAPRSRTAPDHVAAKSDDKPKSAPIATLRELPAEIQRQIPPLSVSGYIYAANPADRSVLINRKLLREGDEVAPGLTLEKLLPNGLVLNYKGYRYRSGY